MGVAAVHTCVISQDLLKQLCEKVEFRAGTQEKVKQELFLKGTISDQE